MSKITEFLKSLGSTSEEIAQNLEIMGIKGEKCNGEFCPIIIAIYQKFPNMCSGLRTTFYHRSSGYVNFGPYGYLWVERSSNFVLTWNDCQTIDPCCPEAIGKFVKDFDNGKYPELVGKSQEQVRKEVLSKLSKQEKMALGI